MLQKVQCEFDSNFLAPHFIILFGLLKYVLPLGPTLANPFLVNYESKWLVNNVFGNKKIVKRLLKKDFKQLLTLSVKSLCFVFNMYYQQADGVAIGSPLGPTLASLFLVNYENKWLVNNIFSNKKRDKGLLKKDFKQLYTLQVLSGS